jgi:transposase
MSRAQREKQNQAKRRSNRKRACNKRRKQEGLYDPNRPVQEGNACGIDVGSREMYVAVPPDRDPEPVQVFQTFTEDLKRLSEWVVACRITTVAMESTGVYWIPLYQILESHGIRVCVVNARHMKNVPGRRTDWHECQWLQYLHSVGLLRAAFRPEQAICATRQLLRHRAEMVAMSSEHVLHMQKSMTEMNLMLANVISDITGTTGLAIIEAILAGERDAEKLAKLRDPRVKADEETIRKSLVGDYREELLYILRQSLELFREYRKRIGEIDEQIQKQMGELPGKVDLKAKPYSPPPKRRNKTKKQKRFEQGSFNMGEEAYRIFGVDTTRIPGMDGLNSYNLIGEVGSDLSAFPSSAHFVSYMGLCPDNDISGGRVLWRGSRKIDNRAAQTFRIAASSLHHSENPLGDYLRRMKGSLGPAGAVFATARKIATIFYTMVKYGREYDESKLVGNEAERRRRLEARIRKQAKALGYTLAPTEERAGARA